MSSALLVVALALSYSPESKFDDSQSSQEHAEEQKVV